MNFCADTPLCLRVEGHTGDCVPNLRRAKALDAAEWRENMLNEMRRLNATLSALPPVLNAIASGVMANVGPALAGPHGEPLTLADITGCHKCDCTESERT